MRDAEIRDQLPENCLISKVDFKDIVMILAVLLPGAVSVMNMTSWKSRPQFVMRFCCPRDVKWTV
jgi:hypothetical protein